MASVSFVVVTHGHRREIASLLPSLAAEMRAEDELIVVDNASSDGTADYVASAGVGRVVRNPVNAGFAQAANDGVAQASGDLVVLLNPDLSIEPGFREAIARPLEEGAGWDVWMGLVLLEDGRGINTSGGVVHFTGLAWAGEIGQPASRAPTTRREVGFASGACLAVPHERWQELGGFPERFFMYGEDVDLSLRVRLAGAKVGIEPSARVRHDYKFTKGALKWRLLERNRWSLVVRTYPTALLVAVLPAMLATEAAIAAAALAQGWFGQKLLAVGDVVRALPELLAERRSIQATRRVSAAEFARAMTAELDSPYLGAPARTTGVRLLLRAYWRGTLALLSAIDSR